MWEVYVAASVNNEHYQTHHLCALGHQKMYILSFNPHHAIPNMYDHHKR